MRGPIELLQDAFVIFQSKPKLYVSIYAVSGVLLLLANVFAPVSGTQSGMVSPLYYLFTFASVIVSIFTTVALIKAISEPETTTFKNSYQFAKEGALQYIILSVMVGIVTCIGFVLFIVPGLIAMTWFGFAYFMLLFEHKQGTEAMKASKKLVDGRFMPIFGRYVALFLAMILAVVVVTLVSSVFGVLIIENLFLIAAYTVLVPVSIAYMYLMYLDAKSEAARQSTSEPNPAVSVDAASPTVSPAAGSVDDSDGSKKDPGSN